MAEIGMFCLGAFIGSVIFYALVSIKKWDKPVGVMSGAISAAVAGGVPLFIKLIDPASNVLSLYPVGLAYGSICVNLYWLKGKQLSKISICSLEWLHVIAFAVLTIGLAIYAAKLLILG